MTLFFSFLMLIQDETLEMVTPVNKSVNVCPHVEWMHPLTIGLRSKRSFTLGLKCVFRT